MCEGEACHRMNANPNDTVQVLAVQLWCGAQLVHYSLLWLILLYSIIRLNCNHAPSSFSLELARNGRSLDLANSPAEVLERLVLDGGAGVVGGLQPTRKLASLCDPAVDGVRPSLSFKLRAAAAAVATKAPARAQGRAQSLPAGSWSASARGAQVRDGVLSCELQCANGSWVPASTTFADADEFENIDGSFRLSKSGPPNRAPAPSSTSPSSASPFSASPFSAQSMRAATGPASVGFPWLGPKLDSIGALSVPIDTALVRTSVCSSAHAETSDFMSTYLRLHQLRMDLRYADGAPGGASPVLFRALVPAVPGLHAAVATGA
eukprot:SAG11_NODE_3996_length_2115_cov_1.402282_1_plen_321_part_00